MHAIVKPSKVAGVITAAASKSAMQRACAAALIRRGETILNNGGISADDKAALGIIQQLGATVTFNSTQIIIESDGVHAVGNAIDCGESGLSVRMFTPIAALSKEPIKIMGSGSLLKRPLAFFNEVLPQLDVDCESSNGYLPLLVKGPLQPKNITVDGSLSSQFLTGLLMAYSAANACEVTITVENLNSRPYIDLTLKVMEDFGLKLPLNKDYKEFYFATESLKSPTSQPLNISIESDWSGAAFLLVAGAIAGKLVVKGLDVFSTQADKAILSALLQTGVEMVVEEDKISMAESKLKPFRFNATDCPDLFPPLVALASFCDGNSIIEGVHRLTHKESNRALTLQEEFGKLGVNIVLQADLMIITGTEAVEGAVLSSHHDHRIAMACAVAALRAKAPVTIEGAEAVNKSYPNFWEHLSQLGAHVSLKD